MQFGSFSGIITAISDMFSEGGQAAGCIKQLTVEDAENGTVNFTVTPDTYFIDHAMVAVGDMVTGFYDAGAPVPLIYPPQYTAIVMAKEMRYQSVKVDFFDSQLTSSDSFLKLNISPATRVLLTNGQLFTANPANHYLAVVYGVTTRSIPAQTTPYQIIVLCR